jgi:hypothetical protein
VFCFFGSIFRELNGSRILVVAGSLCDLDCLLQGFDFAPVVSRWALPALAAMSERQKEFVRLSVFRVASAAALCDADKAQRFRFANGWRYGVMVDSVGTEILKSDGQAAVVVAAVMRQFDLDPRNDPMSRQTQSAVGGRFQHFD